jgi:hypothetical protein
MAHYFSLLFVLFANISLFLNADPLSSARQNGVLRDHFRRQILESRDLIKPFQTLRTPVYVPGLEARTDQMINHFVVDVVQQTNQVIEQLAAVKRSRQDIIKNPGVMNNRMSRKEFADLVEELSKKSGKLHRKLSFVLLGVDSKSKFELVVGETSLGDVYGEEIAFIEREIGKAVRKIEDFFLNPSHTVSVPDLQSENMLINLHRAKEMSKEIAKSL